MDLFLFKNIKKSVFISRANVVGDVVGAIMHRHVVHACAFVCMWVHVCARV